MGQVLDRAIALQHGGEEDPDGPGVRVAVGVPADLPVDGADVEAGAAAQTVERLPQFPGDLSGPAVVEEDQVELLWSLELAGAARPPHQGGVRGELLPGRAASQ